MKKYCLFIFVLAPMFSFGQNSMKLTESSKSEFDSAKQKEGEFARNDKIRKVDNVIAIKTASGKTVRFEDDLSNENYETFEYSGDLIKDKIALIKSQDYNADRYITVNLSNGNQQTLIGVPHLLLDKVICLQGSEPDVEQVIELWRVKNEELKKVKTVALPDGIYPMDIVWYNSKIVLIQDSKGQYWRAGVDGK
jgi:hypothetical protein